MRQKYLFAFILALVLMLSACGSKQETSFWVNIDGQAGQIIFDPQNRSAGTIVMENGIYAFVYETKETLRITYPDGAVYTGMSIGGSYALTLDYNADVPMDKGYLSGEALVGSIQHARKTWDSEGQNQTGLLVVIFLLGLGGWYLLSPQSAWWLAAGWRYKNVEPSDLAIGLYRAGGVLLIIISLIGAIVVLCS